MDFRDFGVVANGPLLKWVKENSVAVVRVNDATRTEYYHIHGAVQLPKTVVDEGIAQDRRSKH